MQLTTVNRAEFNDRLPADTDEDGRIDFASMDGAALPDVVFALARRRKHRHILQAMAIVGDLILITCAFALGATIIYANPFDQQARDVLAAILPVYLLAATTQHAFTLAAVARARISALRAAGALLMAIGLIGLVAFFLHAVGGVSRGVVGLGATLSIGGIVVYRTWLAIFAHRLLGDVTINEVVIQDGVQARVQQGSILLDATASRCGWTARRCSTGWAAACTRRTA